MEKAVETVLMAVVVMARAVVARATAVVAREVAWRAATEGQQEVDEAGIFPLQLR